MSGPSAADEEWCELLRILTKSGDRSVVRRLDEVAGERLCEAEDRGFALARQLDEECLTAMKDQLDAALAEVAGFRLKSPTRIVDAA